MLKILWVSAFTIVCLVSPSYVKAQFLDDFSDGNFTNNPIWSGIDSKFSVVAGELKLAAPATSSNAYLSTPNESMDDATWQFSVRLDFNPSASNYARIYLASDKADLSGSLNGYYVTIGDTPDEVSLYKQTGTVRTKIIDGVDARLNLMAVSVGVKVTRSVAGDWQLFSDTGLTGNYVSEGAVKETTHLASLYSGVYCAYTATRADKFFFDNFIVSGKKADIKPLLPPAKKDIIITEIFADPSPSIELPEYEYIELYNRSTQEYSLSGWQITDGGSVGMLDGKTIKPGQYIIITSTAGLVSFASKGDAIGVPNFPSLNNAGDAILLKAFNGVIIDSVNYTDAWYQDGDKKTGGWSLELIDPENVCSGESNWIASEDKTGGSPGQINSVFANKPDLTGPKLVRAIPLSAQELKLEFDEVLSKSLPSVENFALAPAIKAASISFLDESLKILRLQLSSELAEGVPYTIQCTNIYDCAGNSIQPEFNQALFGRPERAVPGDILINEILFNPKPLGVDFVEVYNNSAKFVNLRNYSLSNMVSDRIENKEIITAEDLLLPPQGYRVFTTEIILLKNQYPLAREENFLRTELPPLPDEEGSIALFDEEGFTIDYLLYNQQAHSPFINDNDGVSLERISFSGSTNDRQNWKSGTSSTGYATPGYQNANTRLAPLSEEAVIISPEIFQPLSGQPDFAQIQYKFDQGGYVANVKIYDAQARLIKEVANNDVLGVEGFYRWDGDTDDSVKARIGYYFVLFEVYDLHGNVKTFRKRVIVAGSF